MLSEVQIRNLTLEDLRYLTWSKPRGPFQTNQGNQFVQDCLDLPSGDLEPIFWVSFWNLWKNSKADIIKMGIYPAKPSAFNNNRQLLSRWTLASKGVPAQVDPYVLQMNKMELTTTEYLNAFPYQIDHVKHLMYAFEKNNRRIIDCSDTGTGKTYTSIALAKEKGLIPFVICPRSVIYSWTEALHHFGFADVNLPNSLVKVVNYETIKVGNLISRRLSKRKVKGKIKLVEFREKTPYLKVIHYHNGYTYFRWQLPPNVLLIFDEVHRCKNHNSINAQLLVAATDAHCNIIGLSATIAESPMKMYAVGYMLGLFTNTKDFWDWAREYGCEQGTFGWEFLGTKKDILKLHKQIFPDRGARMAIADLGDLFPENQLTAELYNMEESNAIQQAYEEMEQELAELAQLGGEDYGANVLVAILRARQKVELLKVPTIVELVKDYEESGNSIVVFANFDLTIKSLQEKLQTKCIIVGGQTTEERQKQIDRFQQDKSTVILCNIQAGGVGINLHDKFGTRQRVSLILPSFSAQNLVQAVGRIWRAGGKSKAIQRIIFAQDTVEDEICRAVRKKISNFNTLNDGDLTKGLVLKTSEFNDYHKVRKELKERPLEESFRDPNFLKVKGKDSNSTILL